MLTDMHCTNSFSFILLPDEKDDAKKQALRMKVREVLVSVAVMDVGTLYFTGICFVCPFRSFMVLHK